MIVTIPGLDEILYVNPDHIVKLMEDRREDEDTREVIIATAFLLSNGNYLHSAEPPNSIAAYINYCEESASPHDTYEVFRINIRS